MIEYMTWYEELMLFGFWTIIAGIGWVANDIYRNSKERITNNKRK